MIFLFIALILKIWNIKIRKPVCFRAIQERGMLLDPAVMGWEMKDITLGGFVRRLALEDPVFLLFWIAFSGVGEEGISYEAPAFIIRGDRLMMFSFLGCQINFYLI